MSQREVTSEQLLEANAATQAHINLVRKYLRFAAVELLKRGESHDLSKFSAEEVETFAQMTSKLKAMTYGSDEYKQCLKDMGPALRHHADGNILRSIELNQQRFHMSDELVAIFRNTANELGFED